MVISLIATWVKPGGGFFGVRGPLARRPAWHPRQGKAMVNVASTDNVEVLVDRKSYRIQSVTDSP